MLGLLCRRHVSPRHRASPDRALGTEIARDTISRVHDAAIRWVFSGDRKRVAAEQLLASSAGQILTSLPGVWIVRAAAFAAPTLPVERFATPEHLYSATGWPPPVTSRHRSTGAARSSPGLPSTATR